MINICKNKFKFIAILEDRLKLNFYLDFTNKLFINGYEQILHIAKSNSDFSFYLLLFMIHIDIYNNIFRKRSVTYKRNY